MEGLRPPYGTCPRDRVNSTYTWTPRGTLATKTPAGQTAQTSAFDAFDRLISDSQATYTYDALDRIHTRNETAFAYAGLEKEPVGDGTQLFSRDPNGDPLALEAGATSLAVRRDLIHGDLTGMFAPSGSGLTEGRAYDPFGAVIGSTGTTNPALGYQSQWTDPTGNRVAMQARWYDPAIGGFASRDDWNNPSLPSAGINRYGYSNGDPLGSTDMTGHYAQAGDYGSLTQVLTGAGAAAGASAGAGVVGGLLGIGGLALGGGLLIHEMHPTPNPNFFNPWAGITMPMPAELTDPYGDLKWQWVKEGMPVGSGEWWLPSPQKDCPRNGCQQTAPAPIPAQTGQQCMINCSRNVPEEKRCTVHCVGDPPAPKAKVQLTPPATPEATEVPASNLVRGEPAHFSKWTNPLDVNPLAGVTQAEAVNQTVVASGQTPSSPDGDWQSPNPGPNLEALRERAREWLNGNDDPCAKDIMRAGKVVWGENECGASGLPGLYDPAKGMQNNASIIEETLAGLGAGRSKGVRVVSSPEDLDDLFAKLSTGGSQASSAYPGKFVHLPDGSTIGLRNASKSGGPTVDVRLPNGRVMKVHVDPWPPTP